MAFLLRVELPDVPGSLGTLATALGAAGADIDAIEIVERRSDGRVVDDVLLDLPPRVMPDALVTACHALEGVEVHWISRYAAGANLSMDLEAVEDFTSDPAHAVTRMVDLLPATLRTDWAVALERRDGVPAVLAASPTAPAVVGAADGWLRVRGAKVVDPAAEWPETELAVAPTRDRSDHRFVVVVGRRGGPAYLASEVARLGHLAALAASVQKV